MDVSTPSEGHDCGIEETAKNPRMAFLERTLNLGLLASIPILDAGQEDQQEYVHEIGGKSRVDTVQEQWAPKLKDDLVAVGIEGTRRETSTRC